MRSPYTTSLERGKYDGGTMFEVTEVDSVENMYSPSSNMTSRKIYLHHEAFMHGTIPEEKTLGTPKRKFAIVVRP
jgi:hypothetical protein